MGSFLMSVANNFCDQPLPQYLDSKTVLIYRPHPVLIGQNGYLPYKYCSVKTALSPSEASQSQAVKEWELRLLRSVVSPHFHVYIFILAFYLKFKVNLIGNFL
jgi:hypothetical protein